MHWGDIACLWSSRDAAHAIDVAVANMTRPAEAIELVGAAVVRACSGEVPWDCPISTDPNALDRWRETIAKRALLRWQAAVRQAIIEDELRDAAERLERRAGKCGVELGRAVYDVLRDACAATRRGLP